jgi:hypothetical protein
LLMFMFGECLDQKMWSSCCTLPLRVFAKGGCESEVASTVGGRYRVFGPVEGTLCMKRRKKQIGWWFAYDARPGRTCL